MLSVCITTYNKSDYIDEAIDSVLNQRTRYDVEILVSDDGSDDDTVAHIIKWQKKFPGIIRYYEMERIKGKKYNFIYRASHNRLNLLKRAKGKYITFLDGDDFYKADDFFENAITTLEMKNNSDCSVFAGRTETYYQDGASAPFGIFPSEEKKLSAEEYWQDKYTAAEGCIFRNKFDIDVRLSGYFDDNLIVLLALNNGRIYCVPKTVVYYRQTASSFLQRDILERSLYSYIDYDVEGMMNSSLQEASYYRHRFEREVLEKYKEEVRISSFPEPYRQAKETGAKTVLAYYENNMQESLADSCQNIKNVLARRIQYDWSRMQLNQIIKKHKNKKIHVVFLCYRPALWVTVNSIYEACRLDAEFEVTIVAIRLWDYCDQSYQDEGAAKFFRNFKCRVLEGYDSQNKKWHTLDELNPDYVFYLQPYNVMLPDIYRSNITRNYAKICFVPYAMSVLGEEIEESTHPADFMNDLSFFFVDSEYRRNWYKGAAVRGGMLDEKHIFFVGYPRYDGIEKYRHKESRAWKLKKESRRQRIIWTPRWATDEGLCNFFDYKDLILEYAKAHPNDVEILFRPHPQMWKNFAYNSKEMSEEEQRTYKSKYEDINNAGIDSQASYMETFFSSDVLLTDGSSIMMDYLLTGKPIIYCHKEKDNFTPLGQILYRGVYVANSWEDVEKYLGDLRQGIDPLKEERYACRETLVPVREVSAGETIKEILKKDYHETRSPKKDC